MPDAANPPAPRPLQVPIFRAVWIASLASNFGTLIQSVGASWTMASMARSPQLVALVQTSNVLPILLLALLAGAIADNCDRRKVLLAAQLFMLLVSAGLTLVAFLGLLSPWTLLAFTFVLGCGSAFNAPAWQASVGDMVPRATLPGAVALNSIGFNIARSLGPAIGGAIVASFGAAVAFLVNALSYTGLITVLLRWRPAYPPRLLPPEPLVDAMAAGLRYVRMSPDILTVLFRAAAFGVAASAVPAMMPLVAREILAGGALTYGVLLGGFGIGAVAGGLGSGWVRNRLGAEAITRASALGLALGAGITAISPTIWLTVPALALAGAGWLLALSTFNVSVQMAAPRWVAGRALALYQMAAFGGMAAGSWGFGTLAEAQSVSLALLAAAAACLANVALGLARPLPPLEQRNLDLTRRWHEPDTAVPVEPRSGPIVITIEYRIAAPDELAFLDAMAERRRIRRRDGARQWTLLRDLMEPDLWIERYHVATWLDYVRHNQRRTHADAENSARLHALHRGSEPLTVHRRIERQVGSLPVARSTGAGPLPTDPTSG